MRVLPQLILQFLLNQLIWFNKYSSLNIIFLINMQLYIE